MAKKKKQEPMKSCIDCIHDDACRMWTNGRMISDESASRCPEHTELRESAAYQIGKLEGVTVQEWIPVTERLPETDDFVLVIATGRAGNVRLVNAVELATYDPTDSHNPWLLEAAPAATEFQVSYWMPLPALPKED